MGYLSDVARRRIAAVILIVGIVLAVLAISDTAFFEDPPTESEKVATTVSGFFDAAAEQDFGRACELLTKEAQDVMRQAAARVLEPADGRLRCAGILETVLGDSLAEVTVRVRSVNIEGNRARAEAALKPEGEPSTFRSIGLALSDEGTWLILDLG